MAVFTNLVIIILTVKCFDALGRVYLEFSESIRIAGNRHRFY